MVSLEQARRLVDLLEQGRQDDADALVVQLVSDNREPIFERVGQLTRQLHDSLVNFQLDPRINDLATSEIPQAKDKLTYVIEKTEAAANRTMDAVDETFQISDRLVATLGQTRPEWDRLMTGRIDVGEFKTLCHTINQLLIQLEQDGNNVRTQLTDILMAQDFQDLTGQVIRRVIELVQEVEEQLVTILTLFSAEQGNLPASDEADKPSQNAADQLAAEGPIVNGDQRNDVVNSQDEVDDLLSSLGF